MLRCFRACLLFMVVGLSPVSAWASGVALTELDLETALNRQSVVLSVSVEKVELGKLKGKIKRVWTGAGASTNYRVGKTEWFPLRDPRYVDTAAVVLKTYWNNRAPDRVKKGDNVVLIPAPAAESQEVEIVEDTPATERKVELLLQPDWPDAYTNGTQPDALKADLADRDLFRRAHFGLLRKNLLNSKVIYEALSGSAGTRLLSHHYESLATSQRVIFLLGLLQYMREHLNDAKLANTVWTFADTTPITPESAAFTVEAYAALRKIVPAHVQGTLKIRILEYLSSKKLRDATAFTTFMLDYAKTRPRHAVIDDDLRRYVGYLPLQPRAEFVKQLLAILPSTTHSGKGLDEFLLQVAHDEVIANPQSTYLEALANVRTDTDPARSCSVATQLVEMALAIGEATPADGAKARALADKQVPFCSNFDAALRTRLDKLPK